MKYFTSILSQFNSKQRIIVLILLLVFSSGTFLAAQWMKQDDCSQMRQELIQMNRDFVEIATIINRKQNEPVLDSAIAPFLIDDTIVHKKLLPVPIPIQDNTQELDEILAISSKWIN